MKQIIAEGAFSPNDKIMWLTWCLLDKCNYSCSYCPIKHDKLMSNENIEKTFALIDKILPLKNTFEVTLFGGEPTIFPKYKYILKELNKRNILIRTFTNLSASNKLYDYAIEMKSTFSISFHPDMCTSLKFINKLKGIDKKSIGFINVMDISGYEKEVDAVCNYCRENEIRHRLAPLHDLGNKNKYIKSIQYNNRKDVKSFYDTKIFFDDNTEKCVTDQECNFFEYKNFYNYYCYKGNTSFYINHDGNIYKCLAEMNDKPKYNLDTDISILLKEEKCNYIKCICENYIPKSILKDFPFEIKHINSNL